MGLIGLHGTFDLKDIVAVFISGILTFYSKEFIEKKMQTDEIKSTVNNNSKSIMIET